MGIGVGINALNWLGLDMYYSSNLGFGGNMQLPPNPLPEKLVIKKVFRYL